MNEDFKGQKSIGQEGSLNRPLNMSQKHPGYVLRSQLYRCWWIFTERRRWSQQEICNKSLVMFTRYSLLSVGPRADPGVQAISPHVTF